MRDGIKVDLVGGDDNIVRNTHALASSRRKFLDVQTRLVLIKAIASCLAAEEVIFLPTPLNGGIVKPL